MSKIAKPITLTLSATEAAAILTPAGEGGQQGFHEMLIGQLQNGNLTVSLTDSQLGKLVRYMTQYGPGGFQTRLRTAFTRPLRTLLGH